MSEELEKLKSIGAQKIYEDTHIPVLHVKAILGHNFDGLLRVQFVGFISILEKEYHIDLSSLKSAGIAYFDDKEALNSDEGLLVLPQKKNKSNTIYMIIVISIFSIVMMYQSGFFGEEKVKEQVIDDVLIQKVQESIRPVNTIEDLNTTTENNLTNEANSTQNIIEPIEETQAVAKSFKIVTKSKVWLGYIDVQTNKKNQKTFQGEIQLDPEKKWLLILGHGYIKIFINGEEVTIESKNNIRYLYEDGSVKAISPSEFKRLNRGSKW